MNSHLSKLDDESGRIEALKLLNVETHSSEASFNHITELLQLVLGMKMVAISLITDSKQIMKARQGFDLSECSRDVAFCNIAIREYEPLIIEDAHQDARVHDNPVVTGPPFLRSYIGAPLTNADGYNIGAICAFDIQPRCFTELDIKIVQKFSILVMNQLELRAQASRDFLTGLYNRRSFLIELERELARQRRSKGEATVAFLDIDHFKRVNDSFGHSVGDRVLREFADIVAGQCRQTDLVARLGGEEFAALLPATDLDSARLWADRVRTQVAETRFDGNQALTLTVSIGLLAVDEEHPTADIIMDKVDSALYEAKRSGRNRIVMR